MAHFAIVIADAAKAHRQEIARNVAANIRAHANAEMDAADLTRLAMHLDKRVRETVGAPKAEGDLHTHMPDTCPDGRPNCRNCGDPAHAATCRAAGHCDKCGTAHGIAPASTLEANGYALVEVDAPQHGHVWDRAERKFVKG
jgi:hypothetical protein